MTTHATSQSPSSSLRDQALRGFGIIAALASGFAAFAEVFLFRRDFGSRFTQRLRVVAPLGLLPLVACFFPAAGDRAGFLIWLMPLYLVRMAMHRWRAFRRCHHAPLVHSRYNGQSILSRLFPRADEAQIKCKAEPCVMFVLGLLALVVSNALGWFLIWTAAGMAIHAGLLARYDEARALDLVDAAIDAEHLAQRVRDLRNEGSGRRNCWRKS